MGQFFIHLGLSRHGSGHDAPNGLPVALAKAVYGHPHGTGCHTERFGDGLIIRVAAGGPGKNRTQVFKKGAFIRLPVRLAQLIKRAFEDSQRPLPLEHLLRRALGRWNPVVQQLRFVCVDAHMQRTAAALERTVLCRIVGYVPHQGREQKTAKAAGFGPRDLNEVFFDQDEEEALQEIARVFLGISTRSKEGIERRPVGLAQRGERLLSAVAVGRGAMDQTPPRVFKRHYTFPTPIAVSTVFGRQTTGEFPIRVSVTLLAEIFKTRLRVIYRHAGGIMDNENGAAFDFEVRRGETEWITSALRLWWLTKFRGYRVITVRQTPQQSAFGRVRYTKRWLVGNNAKKVEE